jgi:hypothetical protein
MLWLLLLLLSVSRIEATCMCLQTYTVATPATTVVMLSVSARVNFFCCSNNSSMHTHGMIKSLVICGHDSTAQHSTAQQDQHKAGSTQGLAPLVAAKSADEQAVTKPENELDGSSCCRRCLWCSPDMVLAAQCSLLCMVMFPGLA